MDEDEDEDNNKNINYKKHNNKLRFILWEEKNISDFLDLFGHNCMAKADRVVVLIVMKF